MPHYDDFTPTHVRHFLCPGIHYFPQDATIEQAEELAERAIIALERGPINVVQRLSLYGPMRCLN